MIVNRTMMKKNIRSCLKDGSGDIEFTDFMDKDDMVNCRLMSEVVIPVNGSIGNHTHEKETEYYIIQEGTGLAIDNGEEKRVHPGDVVVTGDGESHSIANIGDGPLKFLALIVTH